MKWIARSFVFLSALVSGAFTASLFSSDAVVPYPQLQVIEDKQTKPSSCRYRDRR